MNSIVTFHTNEQQASWRVNRLRKTLANLRKVGFAPLVVTHPESTWRHSQVDAPVLIAPIGGNAENARRNAIMGLQSAGGGLPFSDGGSSLSMTGALAIFDDDLRGFIHFNAEGKRRRAAREHVEPVFGAMEEVLKKHPEIIFSLAISKQWERHTRGDFPYAWKAQTPVGACVVSLDAPPPPALPPIPVGWGDYMQAVTSERPALRYMGLAIECEPCLQIPMSCSVATMPTHNGTPAWKKSAGTGGWRPNWRCVWENIRQFYTAGELRALMDDCAALPIPPGMKCMLEEMED